MPELKEQEGVNTSLRELFNEQGSQEFFLENLTGKQQK
jgi:hypothetical protein